MIDLNEDQATLSQWWTLRGRPVNPYLLKDGGTLDEDIKILASDGWDYCVIDGPPYDMDMIEMTVVLASAVVIPVKLAFSDISAIDAIVDMCKRRRKPYAFVVNEYDSRQTFKASTRGARAAHRSRADPQDAHLLSPQVSRRADGREDRARAGRQAGQGGRQTVDGDQGARGSEDDPAGRGGVQWLAARMS